jgi:serine/threonine-protein kinase
MTFDLSQTDLQETPAKARRFGRFHLQELLNQGGMAEIWLATDAEGRPYALRKLRDRLRFNLLARRRFFRGCAILAKLHAHDNVIKYIEHGRIRWLPYLLMEYVEGSNLKQLALEQDPVLQESLAQILIDTAVALEHVHDSGFMHLDFKPENVLVTRNGYVRLVDFDLAQPRPPQPKRLRRNPGTPAYMAPEQLQRQPLDHRADIFAWGVTAYELVTGRKPFEGATPKDILMAQLQRRNELVPPRQINPDVPPGLEKAILRCLEVDPAKRYPDMSMLVHELKNALYVD